MPDLRFAAPKEDRVAVITGGARGIGRACALRLAEGGRHVVVADLLEEESIDVVKAVESLGRRAVAVTTDVTDESAVRSTIAETIERFGRLDILVCCAGILGLEADFLKQTSAQFDKVMRINLYGVYYAHQAALPHMLSQGWGRCATMTSSARLGATNKVPYGVSKGAVYSFIGALGNAYPPRTSS